MPNILGISPDKSRNLPNSRSDGKFFMKDNGSLKFEVQFQITHSRAGNQKAHLSFHPP